MKKKQLILIFLVLINIKPMVGLEIDPNKAETEKKEATEKINKAPGTNSFFFNKKFWFTVISLAVTTSLYLKYKLKYNLLNYSFANNNNSLGLTRQISRVFKPAYMAINLENGSGLEDIKKKCGENKQLAKNFESLHNANKGSDEVLGILRDLVINQKNLPENNIFLREAEKIVTQKHIFPEITKSDFQGFSDEDEDLIFQCFYLLSVLKSKKEAAFQFIAREDLHYTPEKTHNKNQKRKIFSIFQLNN